MAIITSQRIKQIAESMTIAVSNEAMRMKEEGKDVISLSAGEPDFITPQKVCDAAKQALDQGKTKYTPTSGIADLKKAVCRKLKRDNNLDYKTSEVVIGCGAKHVLYELFRVILNRDDEVILPTPTWVSYTEQVKLGYGVPVMVDTFDDGLILTVEKLKKAITPKTKALILNSPSNPTGKVYTKQQMMELGDFLADKNIVVISDEIYEKIMYDGRTHFSIAQHPGMKDKTVIINGVSKAYAMTGWRIGYAAGPEEVIKEIIKLQGHLTSNPTSFAQYAAVTALDDCEEDIALMVKEFEHRRNFIIEYLREQKVEFVYPEGAFYVFINVEKYFNKKYNDTVIKNSLDLCVYLLREHGLAIVPGEAFYADSYVRISYADSIKNIQEGFRRFVRGLSALES